MRPLDGGSALARPREPLPVNAWHGLDLRHLSALRAISVAGSFKGAADALGYTPSAISQQITGLERTIGARVVVRGHGRKALTLTEAGSIILRHLDAIEARLGTARAEIAALGHGVANALRVGAFGSVAGRLLPEILVRFRRECPDVEVIVDEIETFELDSLERGAHDLVFGILPLPPGPFEATAVLLDPWVLVAEKNSSRAAVAPRSLLEMRELPIIVARAASESALCLDCLRVAGIDPLDALRSDCEAVIQEFVAAGLGVAVMPRLAVNDADDRVSVVELGELIPPRQIGIAWHADRRPHPSRHHFTAVSARVGSDLDARYRRSTLQVAGCFFGAPRSALRSVTATS